MMSTPFNQILYETNKIEFCETVTICKKKKKLGTLV